MPLTKMRFEKINLSDPFFDSLKDDYEEFEDWFKRKSELEAYVSHNDLGLIDGFLYLKVEKQALDDMIPMHGVKTRVKLGTFKIDAHGTKLGERFIRVMFDYACRNRINEIYVTIFDKHVSLISLLTKYGFELVSRKNKTTKDGQEGVYFKTLIWR